jgi:pyruvate-formate lyase-activating enzyme
MQPSVNTSWSPIKLLGALFPLIRPRGAAEDASRSSWRERLLGERLDGAIRHFLYRHIGRRVRQRHVRAANPFDPETEAYLRSHICLKPFTTIETSDRGLAHVCCPDWLPTPIGNLKSDLLKQWSGPVAEKIRASILDGSYRYCSRVHCTDISNRLLLPRESKKVRRILAGFSAEPGLTPPPQRIGLSHDRSCNLACPSCRSAQIVASKSEQAKLDRLFDRAVLPALRAAKWVYITGSGDPFGSNHFRRTIKRLNRKEFPRLKFELHTNGQLFDERAWTELGLAGRVTYVQISIDAANPETYAVLRRGGTFARLRKNLAFVRRLKEAGEIEKLEFSMVVQARNFREMPAFVRFGQEFVADVVSFQMVRNWGTFSEAEFQAECIGSKEHPLHEELVAILQAPEMALPIVQAGNILGYARH